jgi:hypothetical protein
MMISRLERTSVHESGHTCAARRLGVEIFEVSMHPRGVTVFSKHIEDQWAQLVVMLAGEGGRADCVRRRRTSWPPLGRRRGRRGRLSHQWVG